MIDFIFESVDELLREDRYDLIDQFLIEISHFPLSEDVIIALLTITLTAKNKLSHREHFYMEQYKRLLGLKSKEELERLLIGL